MLQPLTIISGGQTGVDRGALDAALELGAQCGGWCPAGRKAEDGPIAARYPLTEVTSADYPVRTRRNVEDSDGTLILHCGPLSGGTEFTRETCRLIGRPACLVDAANVPAHAAAEQARRFVLEHGIRRLNVAGPRASHWMQAHEYAREVIRRLLTREHA